MITVKRTFKLYDIINKHFHDENDSRNFVSEIKEIMENKVDIRMKDFATREDLFAQGAQLRKELADFSIRMEQGFKSVEQSLKDQLKWVIILMMSALSLMMAFSKLI